MTVDQVLANVLLHIGLDEKNVHVEKPSYEIRRLLALMNMSGNEIMRRAEWSRLLRLMQVEGCLSEFPLPEDFQRMSGEGGVSLNKPGFHPVRPVVATEQWDFLLQRPSLQAYYRLFSGFLEFSPALEEGGARVCYISKYWLNGKEAITKGDDFLLIPGNLLEKATVWRWNRQKGFPYEDHLAEFEACLFSEIRADRGEKTGI
ncbi:MAG: hypothetical protein PSN37_04820 [Alphaproteobacteria bacterium]|nr:hypothetical protein [Alphaproteobacteria bacterium]